MISIYIGEYIRQRRRQLHKTQQEVSIQIPITEANYNRIETGKSVPQIPTVLAICEVLQIEWDDIKKLYLDSLRSASQLFELSTFCFKRGDNSFAKRTLAKLFSIAKKTEQSHLITVGLFQILYSDTESRNMILANEVVTRMRQMGRQRTAQAIERVLLEKY